MWEVLFSAVALTSGVVVYYLVDCLRHRHWPGVLLAAVGIVWAVAIGALVFAKVGG